MNFGICIVPRSNLHVIAINCFQQLRNGLNVQKYKDILFHISIEYFSMEMLFQWNSDFRRYLNIIKLRFFLPYYFVNIVKNREEKYMTLFLARQPNKKLYKP